MKIIITESQLNLINETLGVPDNILDAADMLYKIICKGLAFVMRACMQHCMGGALHDICHASIF